MCFQPRIEYVVEGVDHRHCIFAVAFLNEKLKGNDKILQLHVSVF